MSKKMKYINAWHARIQKKILEVRSDGYLRLPGVGGGGGAVTYIW